MNRIAAIIMLVSMLPAVALAEVLSKDTVWSNEIIVNEDLVVARGATLTVLPGTTVKFARGKSLEIMGRIEAKGQKAKRITFTALDGQEAAFWDEVRLQQASESFFAYTDFSYATWGIHSHFTPLRISSCRFTDNYGGIRFRSGPLEVSGSEFKRNKIGIRSFRGVGTINRNDITKNEIGIFIREKGAALAIEYNNISANERYGLRLGDFNRQDVNARHNWWGGEDPGKVIFDKQDEAYIGEVHFDPVLPAPVDIIVHD